MPEENKTGKTGRKKSHKRMKAIYSKIREQMEFYFSDASLHKDRFMKKLVDESGDGYIPLETFLTFNKIKQCTDDVNVVAQSIHNKSAMLQLNEEKTEVKRVTPIQEPVNVDERTVYVECLPANVDHEWVKRLFSACGKVVYVSLPRYNSTGDRKGFGFVEFETEDGAQQACEELNNPPVDVTSHVGMFPKTSHQMTALKKKLPDEEIKAVEEKALKLVSEDQPDDVLDEDTDKLDNVENKKPAEISTKPDNEKPLESQIKPVKEKARQDNSENDKQTETTRSPLKRPHTSSDQTTDDDSTDKNRSAKCKKVEVTFNLPDEDEGKATAKKRGKKRKSRSRSSDEFLSDSKDDGENETNEAVPEKKAKLDEVKDGNENKTDGKKDGIKKKKKRFRQKKPRSEKVIPELRVISKKEWLSLKDEYLKLQKTSMAMLKDTLKQVKPDCECMEVVEDKVEEGKRKDIEFVPDVIVKVSADQPTTRQHIKTSLGTDVNIAYIDIQPDSQEGYIRCSNADSAKTICEKSLDGVKFHLLTGEKEKDYWAKLSADRETKLNTKTRTKKRGQQKLVEKAHTRDVQKAERKHVIFDAD